MASGLRVAKQRLRIQLKEALKAMSNEQKKDESLILTQKVCEQAQLSLKINGNYYC